ncbi:hypothetical protein Tco_0193889 [Tanacetum coccineum]
MVGTGRPQRLTLAFLLLTSNCNLRRYPSLSDYSSFLLEGFLPFCYNVSQRRAPLFLIGNFGGSFQCPCGYCGDSERPRLGLGLPDLLGGWKCLGQSLSFKPLLLVGVPDSE